MFLSAITFRPTLVLVTIYLKKTKATDLLWQTAYRGSCYEFHFRFASWDEGEKQCQDKGGHLLSIQSE
jgi:hypothetical protein